MRAVRRGTGPARSLIVGNLLLRIGFALSIVGAAIGWGLDWLFGTRPILTIVFFIMGAGAGILNVNRASKEITERTAAAARAAEEDKER